MLSALRHPWCSGTTVHQPRAAAPLWAARSTRAVSPPLLQKQQQRRPRRRHTASSWQARATPPADDSAAAADAVAAESLPGALADRLARARALEEYRALLAASDCLAPATAVVAAPAQRASRKRRPPPLDLVAATLLVARLERPQLDAAAAAAALEALAAAAEAKLAPGAPRYPLAMARVVSRVLFEEAGFEGAKGDAYYSPDCSCLDQVLAQRKGKYGRRC